MLPPILEARLRKERELAALPQMASEHEVRRRMERLNEEIRKAHYSHVAGPGEGVLPADVESTVCEWRRLRSGT